MHFLDIPTLSLEGVLDVELRYLVVFFKIKPIAKRALHRQENQFERNSFVTTRRSLSLQIVEPIHDAVDSTCQSLLEC